MSQLASSLAVTSRTDASLLISADSFSNLTNRLWVSLRTDARSSWFCSVCSAVLFSMIALSLYETTAAWASAMPCTNSSWSRPSLAACHEPLSAADSRSTSSALTAAYWATGISTWLPSSLCDRPRARAISSSGGNCRPWCSRAATSATPMTCCKRHVSSLAPPLAASSGCALRQQVRPDSVASRRSRGRQPQEGLPPCRAGTIRSTERGGG
mmetsp:Transcript_31461/g.80195  ORF Transcript_31461/g.80195 Transcript_31461/m.80195 type:complete len:212 (+) Transcript_31461:250-885(+)